MKICRIELPGGEICFSFERKQMERLIGCREILFSGLQPTGQTVSAAKLLAPLDAAAVLCIGLNYRKHAEEGKQAIPSALPVLFMKIPTTVTNPGDPIGLPSQVAK